MCLIALTATRPYQQEEKVFNNIYKKLGFHALIDPKYDIKHEERPRYIIVEDVDEFLKIRKGYGAIIWTNSKDAGGIQSAVHASEQVNEMPMTIVGDPIEPE